VAVLPDDLNRRLESALGNASVAEYLINLLNAMPEFRVIDEVVTLTNAVETNLSVVVPAGSVITFVQANLDTTVVGDASGDDLGVKVGIGVTADPDKYGITASLVQNQKVDWVPTFTRLASDEQICVKLAKTDGSAATEKFVSGSRVRVKVGYMRPVTSLPSK
jgi:hypothetical protein